MIAKYVLTCTQPLVTGVAMNGTGACPSGWVSVSAMQLVGAPNSYYFPVCDSAFTPGAGTNAGCPGNFRSVTAAEAFLLHNSFDPTGIGTIVAATASVLAAAWAIRQLKRVLN